MPFYLAEFLPRPMGKRIVFVWSLIDFGKMDCKTPTLDEFGNASGIVQGSSGNSTILVMAHADSVFSADTRHVLEVAPIS